MCARRDVHSAVLFRERQMKIWFRLRIHKIELDQEPYGRIPYTAYASFAL